jgi:signal peptidase
LHKRIGASKDRPKQNRNVPGSDRIALAVGPAKGAKKKAKGFDAAKHVGNVLFLVVFFLVISRILSALIGIPAPFSTVATGSMRPTLSPGDIVIWSLVRVDDVNIGDVIVFRSRVIDENIVHRVVDITSDSEGRRAFITKGDANEYPDQFGPASRIEPLVTDSNLIGRVVSIANVPVKIPLLGSIWLWFTNAFPSSPQGLALAAYAVAGLLIAYVVLTPEEKAMDPRKKNVASVIFGRKRTRLLSAGIVFFLLIGLVIGFASSGSTQEASISIGVRADAHPAKIKIDNIERLQTYSASFVLDNPTALTMRALIFVEGPAANLVPLDKRTFDIAPNEVKNISIPIRVPQGAASGVYDGVIRVYFSALWLMFPPDIGQSLVVQYGVNAITMINLTLAAEITLIVFVLIYLVIGTWYFLDPYIFYWKIKGTKKRVPLRERLARTSGIGPIRAVLASISRWFRTLPSVPFEIRGILATAIIPLAFVPVAITWPWFSIASGIVMLAVSFWYFNRSIYESISSGLIAVAITLIATLAISSLLFVVMLIAPLIGIMSYALGMRWRGEIIFAAELSSLFLILAVLLLPVLNGNVGTNMIFVAAMQTTGIALLLYLFMFLPVLVLSYVPALTIHSWREREEPTVRVRDPSDL